MFTWHVCPVCKVRRRIVATTESTVALECGHGGGRTRWKSSAVSYIAGSVEPVRDDPPPVDADAKEEE